MNWYKLCKSFGRRGLLSLALVAAFGIGGVSLTGCNTTEGAGQDIEAAGEGIQDAAN
ncbi:entericidin A/B family lipoprotein [Phycisphaerales bacterium AB-hyl4]|uniref:Entericidin A/B family lipoprotein n=1 Tax=Natronomicrosphaera hydrolytica TaxID=3242702 RepID=A0ABV4U0U1_9BACT